LVTTISYLEEIQKVFVCENISDVTSQEEGRVTAVGEEQAHG